MQQVIGVVAVVAFLVLFFWAVVRLQTRAERKRAEAWQAEAGRLGLSYQSSDPDFVARQDLVGAFEPGRDDTFESIVSGTVQGVGVVLAARTYSGSGSHGSTSYRDTICVLHIAGIHLPQFSIHARDRVGDVLQLVAEAMQVKMLTEAFFHGDPPFAKQFSVLGEDPAAVGHAVHGLARQALLAYGYPNLNLRARGQRLVLIQQEPIKPTQMQDFIDQVVPLALAFARPAEAAAPCGGPLERRA